MRIGIIGGSGYVGSELLRLLLMHPQVEVTVVTSRQYAGEFVFNMHPNLRGLTQLKFVPQDLAELQKNCDLVFTATPHGGSQTLVPTLLDAGLKVIDMSADFRLKNPADYETYYGWQHLKPEMLNQAVYGLPELHRDEIKNANLIACPGCEATAAILGLAPIVKAGLVDPAKIVVDLKVGSSGGGSQPTIASHHPERSSGVRPYKVVGHRHIAEVEQELTMLCEPVKISFTPHAVNMVRGILATIHTFPKQAITSKDLWRALRGMYGSEPFIRLVKYLKGPYQLPDPKIVTGTNFCDVGFEIDEHAGRLIMFTALDNMVKGAAGQGVQCLNIMMGIDETTALKSTGFHPI
ncbi:N-acetyl-gamma-glutamyl-phosphate reductase [Candidatus Bathycorpusculum sp.]|uniref:N-acetyl-gamma-glutamyl-phosphate reductase n=1 Tax=Candidatus Bathycorpusculum sp. TaxID=2994959 RepID=UPI002825D3A3|nr:N-acetyl-gamma-glutamyl-phosphate reductase [Candidatus Termitimicrobium sp.]MCL2684893.1 N-acetyl-gamma-glutamyl-phosphate reductase [Candidatus Termitimicrobium sp.]